MKAFNIFQTNMQTSVVEFFFKKWVFMIVQQQHCQQHRQTNNFRNRFHPENRDSVAKVLLLQLSIYRPIISLTSNNFVESTFQ